MHQEKQWQKILAEADEWSITAGINRHGKATFQWDLVD